MSAPFYSTPGLPSLRDTFRRGVQAELAETHAGGWTVTDAWVRYAGWQMVLGELAHDIARDAVHGREQCQSDLDLYERISARMSALAAHERATGHTNTSRDA